MNGHVLDPAHKTANWKRAFAGASRGRRSSQSDAVALVHAPGLRRLLINKTSPKTARSRGLARLIGAGAPSGAGKGVGTSDLASQEWNYCKRREREIARSAKRFLPECMCRDNHCSPKPWFRLMKVLQFDLRFSALRRSATCPCQNYWTLVVGCRLACHW